MCFCLTLASFVCCCSPMMVVTIMMTIMILKELVFKKNILCFFKISWANLDSNRFSTFFTFSLCFFCGLCFFFFFVFFSVASFLFASFFFSFCVILGLLFFPFFHCVVVFFSPQWFFMRFCLTQLHTQFNLFY